MYCYLTGKLIEKTPIRVVLETGGIGYQLLVPVSTSGVLPALGENIRLLTEFVVREDSQTLFGFATEEERQMFRLLLSVSGIGPKLAITVLSGKLIADLKRSIVNGDLVSLTGIPGIGKKTAERIIVELREKVVLDERQKQTFVSQGMDESLIEDSVRALIELGYRKQNAKEAVGKVLRQSQDKSLTASEIIRASLKYV
ncbi:MAG: Holliday junction branch migration protein RuvA [Candidatus Omnitrophica bacterium]|nr:Holliday junction branch migration protein RuvA [Candidatus Omnitrophota bacterium]